MSGHALFSPSAAHRFLTCHGSLAMERGIEDSGSSFADEGTAAHDFAARALLSGVRPSDMIGEGVEVNGKSYILGAEMAGHLDLYVDYVRACVGDDGSLLVEERVYFGSAIGQPDELAFGTADAIIMRGDEITVVDLKYGQGVAVSAEANEQLMLYALGALPIAELAWTINTVRVAICQPRKVAAPSEWTLAVEDLRAFAERAAVGAALARGCYDGGEAEQHLTPSEKGCRWCKAKATCPALADKVRSSIADSFDDLTQEAVTVGIRNLDATFSRALGAKMAVVGLVEDWCKAVRARAEGELLAGREVEGFKLVEGRRGPRQWADPMAAEALLKGFRLKTEEMFHLKLISPTDADKLAKAGVIGPRQAPKLAELVVQNPGKPSVAPADDRRPAYSVANDFEDLTTKHPFR